MVRWSKQDSLGYYVHYHVENYKKFGIGYDTPGVSSATAYAENHKNLLSIVRASKTTPNVKALELFLNNVFKTGSNIDFDSYNLNKDNFEALFYQIMEEKFPLFVSDFNHLDLEALTNVFEDNLPKYKGKWGKEKYMMMMTIEKRIAALNMWIYMIMQQVNKGQVDGSKIMPQVKKAVDALNTLNQLAASADGKRSIQFDTEENFNIAKTALNLLSKIAEPSREDLGSAAEYGLSLLFGLMQESAEETADSLVQNFMSGKEKVAQKVVNSKGFLSTNIILDKIKTDKRGKKINFRDYDVGEDGSIIDLTGSQQTADISITLPEGNRLAQEMGISQFTASIKNYEYAGVGANIHVLGETPLLTALSFLTTNFANHYLNLFAETSLNASIGVNDRAAYQEELKKTLLIRALMGVRDFKNFQQNNDLFIVHDRKAGRFKVWDASLLAGDYINKYPYKIHLTINGREDQDPVLTNQYIHGDKKSMEWAIIRISKLVASSHQYKLSLSITLN